MTREEQLEEALTSVAVARQESDNWTHPDYDWKRLARKMEDIARRALGFAARDDQTAPGGDAK